MSEAAGVLLGGEHVNKAISDENFFGLMPEFASIRAQLGAMHATTNLKKGCSPCNQRRIHANIDGNFAAIAASLPPSRAEVLKRYLGIQGRKLYVRAMNPATRHMMAREI